MTASRSRFARSSKRTTSVPSSSPNSGSTKSGCARRQPRPGRRGDRIMRFMIVVKATKESEAGVMPHEQMLTDMAKYHEELQKAGGIRSEEHTSELQSRSDLVCRLLLEKKISDA